MAIPKDHTEKLIEDFPVLFKGKTPRCGIWYGKGWDSLVRHLCDGICNVLADGEEIEVTQIKEKFGTLRFYTYPINVSDANYDLIGELTYLAAKESDSTCEKCGCPGETRDGSWIRTLCDDCAAEV